MRHALCFGVFALCAIVVKCHGTDEGGDKTSALSSLLQVTHIGDALASLPQSSPEINVQPFKLSAVKLAPNSRFAIAQRRNLEVLISINSSQLTCIFTSAANLTKCQGSNCISEGNNDPYSHVPTCEPLPNEMHLGSYYGHYLGHWLSATAMLVANTGNHQIKQKSYDVVQTLATVQKAWGKVYPQDRSVRGLDGEGYIFPYDPSLFALLNSNQNNWRLYSVPYYTLHKIMAGLLDQYQLAGNELAGKTVLSLGDWVVRTVEEAARDQATWQQVLNVEWGGMNEVMFNLFKATGEYSYFTTARLFNHWSWSAPLAIGIDDLAGNHANTHIPEVIGNMVGFELSGNQTDRSIATEFFSAVTTNHSWATGGSNDGEHWGTSMRMGDYLNANTEESCTQYNILKVARHLLRWTSNSSFGDFYERALWNGLIGNQNLLDPNMTQYIYMLPLGGGNITKPWGKSNSDFPCCWGTLSETFAKLSDSIYFSDPSHSTLFVNLFASSSVTWQERGGVVVTQEAGFPESTTSTTTIKVAVPKHQHKHSLEFAMKIRVPAWAISGQNRITLNGQPIPPHSIVPGQWCSIDRVWNDDDMLVVHFPMGYSVVALQDDREEYNSTVAFLYGPLVLAGITGHTSFVGDATLDKLDHFIKRTSANGSPLQFIASGLTGMDRQPVHIVMKPLADITTEGYAVYFDTSPFKEVSYSGSHKSIIPSTSTADFHDGLEGATFAPAFKDQYCTTGNSIRSGNPGQNSTIIITHPIQGRGHQIHHISLSYRYVVGFESTDRPVISVALLYAKNSSLAVVLDTSKPLQGHSYDNFTTYGRVKVSSRHLKLQSDGENALVLAFLVENNGGNVQIPIDNDGFQATIVWKHHGSDNTGLNQMKNVEYADDEDSKPLSFVKPFTHGEHSQWNW